jgi:hypothetical protein
MPAFQWSIALTANQLDERPLANWQFRRLPWRALVRILQKSTTAGVRMSVFAGSQNVIQKSPVQLLATAGQTPSPLNTPAIEFIAQAGDELIISNDEVLAGTPTVDGVIYVDPI